MTAPTSTRGAETDDKSVNLVVGYENGSGKHRGILFDYMNANDITISATFLDKSGNPVRSLQAFAVGDVDFHQSSTVTFNQSNLDVMNPPNSQLTCSGKRCTANFMNNVDGFNEAPKGTFAASGVGTSLTYKHEAPNAIARDLTEFGLFGTGASLASDKIEYLPDPDLNLVKVSEPTCPAALTAAWHKNLVKVPPTRRILRRLLLRPRRSRRRSSPVPVSVPLGWQRFRLSCFLQLPAC